MRHFPDMTSHWLAHFVLALSCSAFFFSPTLHAKARKAKAPTAIAQLEYVRTTAKYDIPDVNVIRKDGKAASILQELNDGRPVLVNFVFTSCAAICPMLSHLFSVVQTKLTKKKAAFHLISISIDPENDNPAKLTEYAIKFHAGKNWDHYTGGLKDITAIQKAMNVFRGDKMNHASVMLLRPAPKQPWIRLEGFMNPDQIVSEFEKSQKEAILSK